MKYPGLEGKNALLIGGHSNIGQHVTRLFCESGANVVIGARDLRRAEEVAEKARKVGDGSVTVVEIDATSQDSVARAVEAVQRLGQLDILYHGVGMVLPGLLETGPRMWDDLYEQNFKSVLVAFKLILPIMTKQQGGCIVVMSSVMGRRPQILEPVYGAFKCALIYLAQSVALQVAPHGIRVNVVAPGPTPPKDFAAISRNSAFRGMAENLEKFNAFAREVAREIPLGQLGDPENVAYTVLHLSSPVTGAFQTGQVLGVDGGWWMPK